LNASIATGGFTASLSVAPSTLQEGVATAGVFSTSVAGTGGLLTGPVNVQFTQRNSYLFILAGSVANQSVQLLGPKVIGGVF
jgi:hypothetical protein